VEGTGAAATTPSHWIRTHIPESALCTPSHGATFPPSLSSSSSDCLPLAYSPTASPGAGGATAGGDRFRGGEGEGRDNVKVAGRSEGEEGGSGEPEDIDGDGDGNEDRGGGGGESEDEDGDGDGGGDSGREQRPPCTPGQRETSRVIQV